MQRASQQDGTYPRPQLLREHWADLNGPWDFASGEGGPFDRTIIVPFPPESRASGIGEPGFHPVLRYRRRITADDVSRAGHAPGRILLLNFGAVDYRADVWIDGQHAVTHEGGGTPFSIEVPGECEVVVRAWDDPRDLAQPRGKQDWELEPHVIWYPRTSGIWQGVWLESVPASSIRGLDWEPDPDHATVALTVGTAGANAGVRVTLNAGDELLAQVTSTADRIDLPLRALRNGQDTVRLLWSPENPVLVDALIELLDEHGTVLDAVASYFGLRTITARDGAFQLNGLPHRIAGVLSQGFWPESHLAAPSAGALRSEVQLIKDLGFTTARIHQKIEDPRFLFWADRLGLMVWTEMPSAYVFDDVAAGRLTAEWTEVVRRDRSHPSVVAWVPFNESWGVDRIAVDVRQQHLVRSLYHLTKALDASRPVISNDGWEHTESDLLTIHDYENDAEVLEASYRTAQTAEASVEGVAPSGRRTFVGPPQAGLPIVLSEFGGVSAAGPGDGWGYRVVPTVEALDQQLAALFAAVQAAEGLAGWCFTQLTDTAQETNGLTDENRVPKLPIERLRAIVRGRD